MKLKAYQPDLILYGGVFDVDKLTSEVKRLELKMAAPDFWNNIESSNIVLEDLKSKKNLLAPIINIKDNIDSLNTYIELIENGFNDYAIEFESLIKNTTKDMSSLETLVYLNGEFDNNNVIFEIHAGAGGTESCDWADMLSRMYTKYFSKKGYTYETLDETPGDEVGIKTVVYLVKGSYAYGFLKNEKGVHRLVRLSPFDSNNRRHTSFAAVDVIPEFDDNSVVEIKDSDIRIDVYRSSGAGGQGVNTTDSAVRITHLPTGIVVTCQNERSQIKNKETALKVLKSKLYQIKLKTQKEKIDSMKSDHSGIEFGSQIRSYVMHPYSMIKDHRTNYETSNVNKVLDGEIDAFVESNLKGEKIK